MTYTIDKWWQRAVHFQNKDDPDPKDASICQQHYEVLFAVQTHIADTSTGISAHCVFTLSVHTHVCVLGMDEHTQDGCIPGLADILNIYKKSIII